MNNEEIFNETEHNNTVTPATEPSSESQIPGSSVDFTEVQASSEYQATDNSVDFTEVQTPSEYQATDNSMDFTEVHTSSEYQATDNFMDFTEVQTPSNTQTDKAVFTKVSSSSENYTYGNTVFNPTGHNETVTVSSEPFKHKPGFLAKTFRLAGAAALFGVIAGGTFIGVNKLYDYYYPDKTDSVSSAISGNELSDGLLLDRPTTDITIQTSTVIPGNAVVQPDVSSVIESVMPSTVSIVSSYITDSYFFGQSYSEGSGSGIIIGENDTEYLIATNNHVVDYATGIMVTFIDDSVHEAYIKGSDSANDLAVIAVKKEALSADTVSAIKVAKLGDSDNTKVGEMVIAIGNALGYGQSCTVGYISAKDREINPTNSSTGSSTTLVVLQTDAAINPGNSGGALVNMNGEVIGINSAKLSATSVEGMGYSIPISSALPIVEDLMTREVLSDEEKGYLGIYMSDVTSDIAAAYDWPVGVYVADIVEGSPAVAAGIMTGDIITGINGITCTNREDLKSKVTSYRYGTAISLTLQRFERGEFKEYVIEVILAKSSDISANDSSTDGRY